MSSIFAAVLVEGGRAYGETRLLAPYEVVRDYTDMNPVYAPHEWQVRWVYEETRPEMVMRHRLVQVAKREWEQVGNPRNIVARVMRATEHDQFLRDTPWSHLYEERQGQLVRGALATLGIDFI